MPKKEMAAKAAAAVAASGAATLSKLQPVTPSQIALLFIWICVGAGWIFFETKHWTSWYRGLRAAGYERLAAGGAKKEVDRDVDGDGHASRKDSTGGRDRDVERLACRTHTGAAITSGSDVLPDRSGDGKKTPPKAISAAVTAPDAENCEAARLKLWRSGVLFGLIMYYFFKAEYRDVFPAAPRTYGRDLFFCILIMLLGCGVATVRRTKPLLLSRDQTEEWKGWMQIWFVLYHYFAAAETYNAIRVFIAAYVWMTGFGNFSFFFTKKDFSVTRLLKMLFRLNFLVTFVCICTNNDYMLYYICAMHTFWFLAVYVTMGVGQSWNEVPWKMAIKFAVFFILCVLLWDVPGVGVVVFRPLYPLLKYQDSLHEWMFRSGLDHFATFVGMLCAYFHPNFSDLLKRLEASSPHGTVQLTSVGIKMSLLVVLAGMCAVWYRLVFVLGKYEYNRLHPYTSWIPIIAYIFARNMFPWLRERFLWLFTFAGRISLECYIAQLHIYMQSNAKELIVYIPGYPLLNWLLATAIYVYISHLLFHVTGTFSDALVPRGCSKVSIAKHCGSVFVVGAVAYLVGFGSVHAMSSS